MKEYKLDTSEIPTEFKLVENSQVAKNSYALCMVDGNTVTPTSPFFVCRDYFSDAVYTLKTGVALRVYGFYTEEYEWDGKHILAWWRLDKETVASKIEQLATYLNKKCLPPIEITSFECNEELNVNIKDIYEGDLVYLVKVDPFYTQSILHVSLLSSLLRLMWYNGLTLTSGGSEHFVSYFLEHKIKGLHIWPSINTVLKEPSLNVLNSSDKAFSELREQIYRENVYAHASCGAYSLFDFISEGEWKEKWDEGYQGMNNDVIKKIVKSINDNFSYMGNQTKIDWLDGDIINDDCDI